MAERRSRVYLAYLLLTQILAAESILQSLSNFLSRDCFEVGRFEDVVNDGGITLKLFGSHCCAMLLEFPGCKGDWSK